MYKEHKQLLLRWFRKIEKEKGSFGTYHHTKKKDGEECYVVAAYDMDEFTDFIRDNIIDLIGFPVMCDGFGIHFTGEDLEKAKYY